MAIDYRKAPPDALWRSYIARHSDADRNALAEHYFYVVKINALKIHKKLPSKVMIDDLISYGSTGLLDAISKFDPSHKIRFSTYASLRIRGAIFDGLRNYATHPRLSMERNKQLAIAEERLTQQSGFRPAIEDVAASLTPDPVLQSKLLHHNRIAHQKSLHSTVDDDKCGLSLLHLLVEDAKAPDPTMQVEIKEMVQHCLQWVLDNCRLTNALVLKLHYFEGMRMKEVGECIRVSESRSAQIHNETLQMVRGAIELESI